MKLKQMKLHIAMFLMLIPLFSAYLLLENDKDNQNSCLTYMKRTFDSLAVGYMDDRTCYSLPQTLGLILYSESKKTTNKILSLIEQRPDDLYETLVDSFHKNLTINKVLIAKDPSNPVAYRAIFPIGKSVYKYVFDSVMEFSHNGDLWIVATDDDKEEIFIMITNSDFKRYVLPTKACQFKSLFMRTYPFDTSVFLPSADYVSGTCWEAQQESKQIARLYKRLYVLKPKDLVKKIARLEKIARDSSYSSPIYDSIFKLSYQLDSIWYKRVDSVFRHSERYRKLLERAAYDALNKGYSCKDLNNWTAEFISPELALSIARSYKVYGFCSMDDSPLRHLSQISWLACQSGNYGVFLKSFYLLFNDYAYRLADASYAWAGRFLNMQIIEEVMEDKGVAFIIGSCLAIDTVKGYSMCNYRRVGQAIKNSTYGNYLLSGLTTLLQNDSLDPYNASLILFSLLWYKRYFSPLDTTYVDTLKIREMVPLSVEGLFKNIIKD